MDWNTFKGHLLPGFSMLYCLCGWLLLHPLVNILLEIFSFFVSSKNLQELPSHAPFPCFGSWDRYSPAILQVWHNYSTTLRRDSLYYDGTIPLSGSYELYRTCGSGGIYFLLLVHYCNEQFTAFLDNACSWIFITIERWPESLENYWGTSRVSSFQSRTQGYVCQNYNNGWERWMSRQDELGFQI